MENPKPKYAISDFELQPYEPISSRRGEDETPLVKYSSKSSTPFDVSDPVSDPLSDPCVSPSRKYCGMSKPVACNTGVLVVIAIVALVTGLAVGLKPSVSSGCIPYPYITLAKHDYRKKHSGDLVRWIHGSDFGNYLCGYNYSIDTTDVALPHYSFFNASSTGSDWRASTVCGHKLKAKGPGGSFTLTVVDRCECIGPTQPCSTDWTIKQQYRQYLWCRRSSRR